MLRFSKTSLPVRLESQNCAHAAYLMTSFLPASWVLGIGSIFYRIGVRPAGYGRAVLAAGRVSPGGNGKIPTPAEATRGLPREDRVAEKHKPFGAGSKGSEPCSHRRPSTFSFRFNSFKTFSGIVFRTSGSGGGRPRPGGSFFGAVHDRREVKVR